MREQYYTLKLKKGERMIAHVSKLQKLQEELKEMGEKIDDQELAMTLLGSLPLEKYKTLVISLDVVGESELSFERMEAILLNDADRVADNFARRRGAANGRVQGFCDLSHKTGHNARFQSEELQQPFFRYKSTGRVSNRGRGGRVQSSSAMSSSVAESSSSCEFAWYASANVSYAQESWIVDSGASQHMTSDQAKFTVLRV